jgi:intein-encoded DNA endonuclease-like protein
MENKSMTAVEWLFKQLWDEPKDKFTWYAILKQANEIDKHNIKEAFVIGKISSKTNDLNSEKYYAEKYGKTFLDLVSNEKSQVHEIVKKLKEKKEGNK